VLQLCQTSLKVLLTQSSELAVSYALYACRSNQGSRLFTIFSRLNKQSQLSESPPLAQHAKRVEAFILLLSLQRH
jgi:hypothetical protein